MGRREQLAELIRELRDEERRAIREVRIGRKGAEGRLAELRAEIDRLNDLRSRSDRL